MITKISAYIMPFVILIIVGYGMYKKSDNYDNFVNGAEDGMRTVVSIVFTLISGFMPAPWVPRRSQPWRVPECLFRQLRRAWLRPAPTHRCR